MNAVAKQENRPVRENQEPSRSYIYPNVDIVETKDGYVLEAEMPGVGKDGLEVLLEGHELTIIGRRTSPAETADLVYRESAQSDYRRTFELDPVIDTPKIAARIENGLLTLNLPKTEQVKPRKIAVTG